MMSFSSGLGSASSSSCTQQLLAMHGATMTSRQYL
jgi:hypothetical protein